MLIAEPLWVFSSVGFCVACGRKQLSEVESLWRNKYFFVIMVKMLLFFIPVESWILYSHTDWETTFLLDKGSDLLPRFAILASFLHLAVAVFAYWLNMRLLRKYDSSIVVKLSLFGFGVFFASQGMFYDTLMYSGSYEEFHDGVHKSFLSFFMTERFRDAYIMFFVCFGPIFFYIALSWHQVCTPDERKEFIKLLWSEVLVQGTFLCFVYVLISIFGLVSERFTLSRLPIVAVMFFVPICTLILPFHIFHGRETEKID